MTDCDIKWQNVTWNDRVWHQMTECDMKWQIVTSNDRMWHEMTECDIKWQIVTWNDRLWDDRLRNKIRWCLSTRNIFNSRPHRVVHQHGQGSFTKASTQSSLLWKMFAVHKVDHRPYLLLLVGAVTDISKKSGKRNLFSGGAVQWR